MRRSEKMQQTKTYTSGMFKGEARKQFEKDLKKMAKDGWHLHTLNDAAVGADQVHKSQLTVVYEKKEAIS
jgi:hypothetical protein